MKLLKQVLRVVSISALLAMGSCASEAPWSVSSGEEGRISLQLSADVSVYTSTRANDNESPVRPSGDMFKIRLESTDQSYSKEWESTTAFNKEEGFPRGSYTIYATYGDLEQEGFLNPYYVGSESVNVAAGEESSVSVQAALANSMVSIRYTDSFRGSFSQYAAALVSETGTPVAFVQGEERPAYVKPGYIKVEFSLTNQAGQSVIVAPATFNAVPRRHYIITVNVENSGSTGNEVLNVIFEEDVVADKFDIVLGDELYTAPEPEIVLAGVEGIAIEAFEKMPLGDINPEFHVKAYGGIKSATFSIASVNGKLPAFGNSVELVGADEMTKALIKSSYLECYGFYENTDKLGVVNMKKFIENLDPGDYQMSLDVTDGLGRTVSADKLITLSTTVNPVEYDFSCDEPPMYMGKEVVVDFYTNYEGAKEMVTFKISDLEDNFQDAKVISITPLNDNENNFGNTLQYAYRYVLEGPEIDDSELQIETTCAGKTKKLEHIAVLLPEYKVETDAFAKKVMLKIVPEDPSQLVNIMKHIKVYADNGSTHIPSPGYALSRNEESGILVISGLTSETKYDMIGVSIGSSYTNNNKVVTFTTEAEANIPNGDFSESTKTIDIPNVQVGGQYRVSPVDYTLKSSIVRSTPDKWANLNSLTCYEGSSNKNTWFLVPSTFVEDGVVVIRTVGYNHNGTTPNKSGGAFNTTYYCENAPSDNQLEKSAGELFLGSYSYNGSESRSDGIAFSTRPDYISFTYQYNPKGSDEGEMYIRLLDASGNVLVSNSMRLTAVTIDRSIVLPLEGYKFGDKVASIQLGFRSTASDLKPEVDIPSGSSLNENKNLGNHTLPANSYHAFAMGSELKVMNVTLGYGDMPEATRMPHRIRK